jgi:hypothetical protein
VTTRNSASFAASWRWAADNAASIKERKPLLPSNFNNRLAANWKMLLAIAEVAGSGWSKQAREAAERLSHTNRKPSWGIKMLQTFAAIFASGRRTISSKEVVAILTADLDDVWCAYNHGGPITQRQVAAVLEPFDVHPVVIHPNKRSNLSPRGYKVEQFRDAFTRFLPAEVHIRTPRQKSRK